MRVSPRLIAATLRSGLAALAVVTVILVVEYAAQHALAAGALVLALVACLGVLNRRDSRR